jgi:hypothetical protein
MNVAGPAIGPLRSRVLGTVRACWRGRSGEVGAITSSACSRFRPSG